MCVKILRGKRQASNTKSQGCVVSCVGKHLGEGLFDANVEKANDREMMMMVRTNERKIKSRAAAMAIGTSRFTRARARRPSLTRLPV